MSETLLSAAAGHPAGPLAMLVLVLLKFGVALALAGLLVVVPVGLLFDKITADAASAFRAPRTPFTLKVLGLLAPASQGIQALRRPPRLLS